MRQIKLFKDDEKAFGGSLMTTVKGRLGGRPLATRKTMHLILRSSQAHGDFSFKKPCHERKIKLIITKFSQKYGVKIYSLANVGNHLHFQIKLSNRHAYYAFIRAITSAIAMAVTGASRWNPIKKSTKFKGSFWDRRPITRVVIGKKAFLNLRDYILLNQLEGFGIDKNRGRFLIKMNPLLRTD
jgi:REP element-mobilizing transposase RayT